MWKKHNISDLIDNYISRHIRCLVNNLILFIGNVDRILSEEYYIDTEEKLPFFTTFFGQKNINIYKVV